MQRNVGMLTVCLGAAAFGACSGKPAEPEPTAALEGGKNRTPVYVGRLLYSAVFDGQGHTINGVTVTPAELIPVGYDETLYGTGFFGQVSVSFTVKNVRFTNEKPEAVSKHCGGAIGSIESGAAVVELDHVTVSGLVLSGGAVF